MCRIVDFYDFEPWVSAKLTGAHKILGEVGKLFNILVNIIAVRGNAVQFTVVRYI